MRNGEYTLVVAPKEYPGKRYRGRYCYEHHLVFWQKTGKVLINGECLHHINGDHRDNRFENLVKITSTKHKKHHSPVKPLKTFNCTGCGRLVKRKNNNYQKSIRVNKMGIFCSRSCATKFQFRGSSIGSSVRLLSGSV